MRLHIVCAATFTFTFLLFGCGQREKPVKADPRDARLAELARENERLRAEREAAQRSTAELDSTLREVESELGALVGLDSDIRELQRDIESGVEVRSARKNVRNLIDRLKTALSQRKDLVAKAQTGLTKVKEQVNQQDASIRDAYLQRVSQLQLIINHQTAENARLASERDSFERLYRQALAQAKDARTDADEARVERDEERRQREEAERLQNVVFVVVGSRDELRKKGLLTGRWYQRKSSNCVCADCLTEEDRRTLDAILIPAPSNRVRVYSSHPKGSFRVAPTSAKEATIEILDRDKFWSSVHCAVIGY